MCSGAILVTRFLTTTSNTALMEQRHLGMWVCYDTWFLSCVSCFRLSVGILRDVMGFVYKILCDFLRFCGILFKFFEILFVVSEIFGLIEILWDLQGF